VIEAFLGLERFFYKCLIRKACVPAIVFMIANFSVFLPSRTEATEFGAYIGAGCDGAKRIGDFEQFVGRKVERTVDALNQTLVFPSQTAEQNGGLVALFPRKRSRLIRSVMSDCGCHTSLLAPSDVVAAGPPAI